MTSQQDEVNRLVATIQALKNRDLISICQSNNLVKSGNKADLHKRIINYIDASVHDPNQRNYVNMRNSIMQVTNGTLAAANYRSAYLGGGNSPMPSSPSSYNNQAAGMSSPYNGASGTANGLGGARAAVFSHQGLQFKPSPFYEIETPLGDVRQCEAMAQHRNSITIVIRASQYPDLQRCLTDPNMRIMIFCAANNYGIQDIAFPYQCEIKVNTGEVKANLRGLKNKPGSTRPVDITDLIRLKPPTYGNSLEFTYALTNKRFYLALYLCKTFSATTLASRIEKRSRITKDSVVREVTKQAQDPDIVATSLVLSLKCPLTYMRLALPVRATTCKHIQCFDATSYLQLQEQGPQWLCPICSNPAPYDSLAVDEYVKDILENTSSELDQVTIDPDGTWHTGKDQGSGGGGGRGGGGGGGASTPPRASVSASAATLLDDEFEILSTPIPTKRSNGYSNGSSNRNGNDLSSSNAATLINSRDTTATPNRSTSTPSGNGGNGNGLNSNNKRPREVIDLTLSSDDEDDEPLPRRFKRQNTGNGNGNSYSGSGTGSGSGMGTGSSSALYNNNALGNGAF